MVALSAGSSLAQDVRGEEVQTFDALYFERFAPQTARDMLQQVPGFSVRETGGGRGLGQGGANVLINGERVTSKDTNALDILDQTPASAVVRIEVADAASLGVTGLTGQVANVVIDRGAISGSWEWAPLFRHNARPRLHRASASVAGSTGRLDYTIGIDHGSWRGTEEGYERRLLVDGTLVEERFEDERSRMEHPQLTVALDYDLGEKTDLSLTSSVAVMNNEGREDSFGPDDLRRASNGEDEWNASLSAELGRDIGSGTLRLIGFQRFEHSPFISKNETLFTDGSAKTIIFNSDQDEGETIARSEYAFTRPGNVSWEVALEGAFNFLEVENLLRFDDGTTQTEDRFPTTRVDELRTQASLTRGFTWFDKMAVQASLAGEWSRLTVDSATSMREETFLRPKGSVSLSYPFADKLDVRGRVERAVGQLDFGDFVSSVDLTEDRDFAGNTGLVPQQSWIGEVELERRFGDSEKIIVRVVGELIEDRIDRVLIDGEDAVGNIDEARAVSFETEGTILTDRWRVDGGRLDFRYSRFGSEIEDPITEQTRGFNGAHDWNYEFNFRQDVPSTPYAWGVSARHEDDFRVVRFNEILRRSTSVPRYDLFAEHKDFFGLNLRVGAENLANAEFDLERVRFAGLRTEAPVDIIERRVRTENQRFFIRLSGTF